MKVPSPKFHYQKFKAYTARVRTLSFLIMFKFKSVDDILKGGHSYNSYREQIYLMSVCFSVICNWNMGTFLDSKN